MELRIIANFSKDPIWVDAFNAGKDLHSELCALTFDIPIEDVPKPTPFKPGIAYRDVQKTLNFGLAYGMSHYKLADTIDVSEEVAKSIIATFFSKVPKVQQFLTMLGERGKKNFQIRTAPPYGRIRFFKRAYDFKNLGEIERASKNMPIQGTNADITKLALIRARRVIKAGDLPVMLVHTVHDEIITETVETYAEEWKPILTGIMNDAAKVVLTNVPVKTDVKISQSWPK